jgi:hypothetical protein
VCLTALASLSLSLSQLFLFFVFIYFFNARSVLEGDCFFVEIKLSYLITGLDRPLGLQKVEASRISRQSAHEGGKVVSPCTSCLYPLGDTLGTNFC